MPAISNLIINDGLTTPVARTFAVQRTDGSKATWLERTAGILAGFFTLSDEVRQPTTATAAWRRIIGLAVPTIGTVNGVSQVVRTSSAQVVFNFSQTSTEQERKDMVAYIINYLNDAVRRTAIVNNEPFF